MPSPNCEAAISVAAGTGNALLKFISANDVNATGAHQYGFYLPKQDGVWQMFSGHPPQKGTLEKELVSIRWQVEEYETQSAITWYGKGTRSEYRLTRFGRNFPYLTRDSVGDLLILIPVGPRQFRAFLIDLEDDIEELEAALGLQIGDSWAVYRNGAGQEESEDECVERAFGEFVEGLVAFPPGQVFSQTTHRTLDDCVRGFAQRDLDSSLTKLMESEYRLFKMAERSLCTAEVRRLFRDIDDFLTVAATVMNRRKSRAGRSLENHVSALLVRRQIPHVMRPNAIDGKPDVVIPSVEAYLNLDWPTERLYVIGLKTTCKDRWRQILNEARRVQRKYILTTQPGISANQLQEMHEAGVSLVVPESLHREYPRGTQIQILSLEEFASRVETTLAR
ncbi:MAG TPA: type II restriction endonuclease [Acidobacteriaceae bacterium]|jgi:type II restriction enzyme|nr:type II restriction endonuclease [Acidobacteriaceae bacterium]